MKKIICGLVCLILVTGCSQVKEQVETQTANEVSSTDSLDNTFYRSVNININTTREKYYSNFGQSVDFKTIGRELELLSTSHFSTDEYYKAEGQYLNNDDLDQLTKRADDPKKYPNTLQPQKGEVIDNVLNPIMIASIYEQDFYIKSGDKYVIKGLSLAIVIDPSDADGKHLSKDMGADIIKTYSETSIKKLYDYVRTKAELKNVPLNICVYLATNPEKSLIDGTYIYSSYCENGVGQIEELNYDNVIFTSPEAEKLDNPTYIQFLQFKLLLKKGGTEAVGIIGYGRYKNDEIQSLKIDLNLNVKTYEELEYMIGIAAEDLNSRFTQPMDIKVLVYSQDKLEATIYKKRGEKAQSTLLY